MSPQKLTLRSAVSPITAVAFLSPIYILAGESHCINVFAASDGICSVKTSSKKKRIFSRNRVHGIVVSQCNQHVLFWGGRSIGVYPRDAVITIVDDDNDEDEEWRERESVAPDWVLSAAFLSDDCRRVVAVGAHNSLFVYDCVSRRWDNTSGASIEERTMLYSADLAVSTDGVCVAAGTVFGEIIVWDWWREAKTGVVKRRFRGHEGSVFAVRLCRQNWVASCSDDRTVRVWDLSCGEPVLPPTGQEVGEAKSTGFVETHGGKGCVALGWGHQARPWGVRFLDPDGGSTFDEVRLISVSEDLTTRFWSFVPKPGLTVEMKNTHTWKLHSGKHIWSFALDPDTQRMATGGNDGRVVLLDYSDDVEIQEEWVFEEVMEMVSSSTLQPDREPEKQPYMQMQKKKKKNKPRDAFKNYAMLDQDRFVVSTVFGHVLAYNMKTKIWKSLGKWEELMNWSAIDSWDGACLVALGDSKGNLGILDINREREWWWDAGGKGKVTGVFVGSKYGDLYQVITTSLPCSTSVLHSFRLPDSSLVEPIISHKLILRHPNDTKLTISSVHISIETSRIFLGTRTGDLAIYSLPTITALSTTSSIDADSFYPSLHSPDALTSLSLSPTSPNTLFTTSFSGVFAVYDLSGDTPIPTHILQSPNLTNISGLSHPGPTLHGFSGTKFLTFCTRTQSTPLTFPCGGAHRAWCFNPQSQTFVWTQASRLNVFRAARPRTVVAKAGYHGREIKTAAYTKCGGGILATGAEDTTIRITRIGDGKAGIEQNPSDGGGGAVVKRHTTGVLHLLWSSDGTRLFSSGGVEELFVFRITATEALGVIEESVCPVPNSSAEVRICGFDIVEDNGGFVVVVAMSDSCLRVWRYTPPATPGTAGLWIILQEGLYTTCCLLSVKTLRYADGGLGALISATDGCLTLYRLDTLMSQFEPCPLGQWIWRHRVHQSSIKSLDVAIEETNAATEMHIYTGGDDCAIAHTIVLVTDNGQKATTKKSTIIPCAHAAAVTAVAALKNSTTILTAGTDQKVKLWQVGQDEITSIGKRAGESGVADISGAAVVNDEVVVIVGMGVEFWRVK